MVTTDPIADMLSRIRNAIAVNQAAINLPHSNLKARVAEVLKEQGFIEDVSAEDVAGFKRLNLTLFKPGENAHITALKRLSSPGRRLYANASRLPRSMNGRGVVIVSTSQGIMTDGQARQKRVGGELICEVY
jgi:small subunit ribosomal protein S8